MTLEHLILLSIFPRLATRVKKTLPGQTIRPVKEDTPHITEALKDGWRDESAVQTRLNYIT